jgi:antitoxin HigA-1
MTQTRLAEKMGVPIQVVNMLVNGNRGVTAETAILLSRIFKTTWQFRMNLQTARDLWEAERKMKRAV